MISLLQIANNAAREIGVFECLQLDDVSSMPESRDQLLKRVGRQKLAVQVTDQSGGLRNCSGRPDLADHPGRVTKRFVFVGEYSLRELCSHQTEESSYPLYRFSRFMNGFRELILTVEVAGCGHLELVHRHPLDADAEQL